MTTKTKPAQKLAPVVVTTLHKGVFFGYVLAPSDWSPEKKHIKLVNARMCVYWAQSVQGVVGLAGRGPDKNCKVTVATETIHLTDVTSVMGCTQEAAEAWEKQPWA